MMHWSGPTELPAERKGQEGAPLGKQVGTLAKAKSARSGILQDRCGGRSFNGHRASHSGKNMKTFAPVKRKFFYRCTLGVLKVGQGNAGNADTGLMKMCRRPVTVTCGGRLGKSVFYNPFNLRCTNAGMRLERSARIVRVLDGVRAMYMQMIWAVLCRFVSLFLAAETQIFL